MSIKYRFKCKSCHAWHEGIPAWGWNFPPEYFMVPEDERETRCFLTSDLCVVDDKRFFICGCLEFPVVGSAEILSLGVWIFVREADFFAFQDLIGVEKRADHGPFEGILSVPIPTYPETMGLEVLVQIRDNGIRPYIELKPSVNPIYDEQKNGVPEQRLLELYDYFEHGRFEN